MGDKLALLGCTTQACISDTVQVLPPVCARASQSLPAAAAYAQCSLTCN